MMCRGLSLSTTDPRHLLKKTATKMINTPTMPVELLNLIFSYTLSISTCGPDRDMESLKHLALVCKAWLPLARQALFEKVTWIFPRGNKTLAFFKETPHIAHLVRHISIKHFNGASDGSPHNLPRVFPNVTSLNFRPAWEMLYQRYHVQHVTSVIAILAEFPKLDHLSICVHPSVQGEITFPEKLQIREFRNRVKDRDEASAQDTHALVSLARTQAKHNLTVIRFDRYYLGHGSWHQAISPLQEFTALEEIHLGQLRFGGGRTSVPERGMWFACFNSRPSPPPPD